MSRDQPPPLCVQCTVYSVQCTITVQCTVYSVQCTITVHCTVYSVLNCTNLSAQLFFQASLSLSIVLNLVPFLGKLSANSPSAVSNITRYLGQIQIQCDPLNMRIEKNIYITVVNCRWHS